MFKCKDANLDHMREKLILQSLKRAKNKVVTRSDIRFLAEDTNSPEEYVTDVIGKA